MYILFRKACWEQKGKIDKTKIWGLKEREKYSSRDKARNVPTKDLDWDEINSRMAKIIKKVCEVSKSTGRKETWWCHSRTVKKVLKEKKGK